MKNQITEGQIDSYQKNGFVIIEDFFSSMNFRIGGKLLQRLSRKGRVGNFRTRVSKLVKMMVSMRMQIIMEKYLINS